MRKFDLVTAIRAVKTTTVAQLSFGELVAGYCADTSDGVNRGDDAPRLRKWVEAFGHLSAWEVTSAQLATAAKAMKESGQYKPSSINRDLGSIGSAYKWIVSLRRAPEGFASPSVSVKRFGETPRIITIAPEKIQKLRALSITSRDKRFGLYVHLLIDTGARKSELLERSWGEMDIDTRQIELKTSKTGRPRVLHFTEATAALIRRFVPVRPKDALIFPGSIPSIPKDYRAAWRRLVKMAGCPEVHQHDIRHNRARELLVAGISLPVAAGIMGHSAQVLEKRYGHLDVTDHLKAVEQSWGMAA